MISEGALVRISIGVIGFSHSSNSFETTKFKMHTYNGSISNLDIKLGTHMILPIIDNAILKMQLNEMKEIVISAAGAAETARSMGVNLCGLLKYQIQLLSVTNIPDSEMELKSFFIKSETFLDLLSVIESIQRGKFNVTKTYDMVEAVKISEQYKILDGVVVDKMKKQSLSSLIRDNTNPFTPTEPLLFSSSTTPVSSSPSWESLRLEIHGRDTNSHLHTSNSNAVNSSIRFILPKWSFSQLPELFLPELLRIAIASETRIIILFDFEGDWDKIKSNRRKSDCSTNNVLSTIKESNNEREDDETNSDDDANIDTGNKDNKHQNIADKSVVEAELSMAVEREEIDSTANTVLTWLRVATENENVDITNPPSSSSSSSQRFEVVNNNETTTEPEKATIKSNNINDETIKNLTVVNISKEESVYGYRCALIRFTGWSAGMAPQKRLWSGFWDIYQRYLLLF